MKKNVLYLFAAGCAAFTGVATANAQTDETVVVTESETVVTDVNCKTHYYTNKNQNWFIQIGAGINSPFTENVKQNGTKKHHLSVAYNVGFGKWFSPYLGFRMSFIGGPLHYNQGVYRKSKYVQGNLDFMWDMFNSLGGVNSKRVFSIVPFVGLGGAFNWDFNTPGNITNNDGKAKRNSWTLPVSAGLQLRFRLCKYVDFFAEGRASFFGDNFNNIAFGKPIDVNLSCIGGFAFNLGGRDYESYNPCDYLGYISNLNNQVNDLRAALATSNAALAAAEAQLPCPEVTQPEPQSAPATPLLATVRFKINSAKISKEEEVNVYNIAEWMKANPNQNVVITGYADKDTGTSAYNMKLSERRAKAVYDQLTKKYGIDASRLATDAEGSNVQPYPTNNWNRIVIFGQK